MFIGISLFLPDLKSCTVSLVEFVHVGHQILPSGQMFLCGALNKFPIKILPLDLLAANEMLRMMYNNDTYSRVKRGQILDGWDLLKPLCFWAS